MACYQCGSEDGNEARLCAACNAKRMQRMEKLEQGTLKLGEVPVNPKDEQRALYVKVGGGAAVVLALCFALFGSSSSHVDEGNVPKAPVDAFQGCTEAAKSKGASFAADVKVIRAKLYKAKYPQIQEGQQDLGFIESEEVMAGLSDALLGAAQTMPQSFCDSGQQTCKIRPDGEACANFKAAVQALHAG